MFLGVVSRTWQNHDQCRPNNRTECLTIVFRSRGSTGILISDLIYVKGILSSWDVIDRLIINLCSLDCLFFSETLSINKS